MDDVTPPHALLILMSDSDFRQVIAGIVVFAACHWQKVKNEPFPVDMFERQYEEGEIDKEMVQLMTMQLHSLFCMGNPIIHDENIRRLYQSLLILVSTYNC